VGTAGCLDYEEEIWINADQSGTQKVHFAFSLEMLPADMRREIRDGFNQAKGQGNVMIEPSLQAQGINVKKVDERWEGDAYHVRILVGFNNLDMLNAFHTNMETGGSPYYLTFESGLNYILCMGLIEPLDMNQMMTAMPGNPEMAKHRKEMEREAEKLLKQLNVKYTVHFPFPIKEVEGARKGPDANTLVWSFTWQQVGKRQIAMRALAGGKDAPSLSSFKRTDEPEVRVEPLKMRLLSLEGTVELRPADSETWKPAAAPSDLPPGTMVRTGAEAKAVVHSTAGIILCLEPGTTLDVRADRLALWQGQVRCRVPRREENPLSLSLKTPDALLQLNRGMFSAQRTQEGTTVAVYQGPITIQAAKQEATLQDRQTARIPPGKPPAAPEWLNNEAWTQWQKMIWPTLPTAPPGGGEK
jgi:hypothetical protein